MIRTSLVVALIAGAVISANAGAGIPSIGKVFEVLESVDESAVEGTLSDTKDTLAKPAWAQEPLLVADNCDNITIRNIESFINKYREPTNPKDSLEVEGEKLMKSYTLSAAIVNRSLLCTAQSLDMKETIKELNLERQILLSGTSLSQKELDKQREYSQSANEAIVNKLSETKKLQPEQQKTMGLAFGMFFLGTHYTYEMKKPLENYVSKATAQSLKTVKNDPGILLNKDGQGAIPQLVELGETLSQHFKRLYSTAIQFTQFASNNNIPVPNAMDQVAGKW